MSFMFVEPNPNVITCVERAIDFPHPDYQVCGKTRCVRCDQWCWLGDKSLEVVSAGQATPICQPCLTEIYAKGPAPIAFDILQNSQRKDLP